MSCHDFLYIQLPTSAACAKQLLSSCNTNTLDCHVATSHTSSCQLVQHVLSNCCQLAVLTYCIVRSRILLLVQLPISAACAEQFLSNCNTNTLQAGGSLLLGWHRLGLLQKPCDHLLLCNSILLCCTAW